MAEKKTIELEIKSNLDSAEKSVGNLKSQLRQAQAEVASLSDKFGATSKEAVAAAKSAAILKDKIGDAKSLTDAFNPDAKFKALSSSLGGVASGFAAYQGALGLVGVESKDLEKQLLKVQSAMAIAEGLQGLGEAKDSFKQLQAVGVNAFKAIKESIGSTGIGLIVIAAGAIYAYWDDIKATVSGVNEEQKKLNNLSKTDADLSASKLKDLGNQDNVLKLQGKSEKDILNIKIKATDQAISTAKIQVENQKITNKLAIDAAERNANITKAIIRGSLELGALGLRLIAAPIDLVLKTANKVSEALGFGKITAIDLNGEITKLIEYGSKSITSVLFDPEKTRAEGAATIKEAKDTIAKMTNDAAGMKLAINAIDKTAADDATKIKEDSNKKAEEAEIKAKEDAQKEKEDNAKQLRDKQIADEYAIMDAIDAAKKANLDAGKTTAQLAIEAEDAAYKLKYDMAVKYGQDTTDLTTQHNAIQLKNEKDNTDAKIELSKKEAEAKIANLKSGSAMLSNISGLIGKNTAAGKVAAVAAATIDTYAAAQSAFKNAQENPISIIGPAYPYIQAGLAIAGGLKNVQSILAVKTPGGSGGSAPSGGGMGAGGGGAAPSFNVVGASATNQLAQTIGNQQQQPIKAYVVSADVTTAQSLDRNIISSASIG